MGRAASLVADDHGVLMATWGTGQDVITTVPVLAYRARTTAAELWELTWVAGGLVLHVGGSATTLRSDPGGWVLWIHPEDRERVLTERRQALRTGRLETEYRLVTTAGTTLWVHDVAVRNDSAPDQVDGLVVDLTDHHHAETALAGLHDARLAAVNQVARASTLRDTTLRLFVHDLRSPLSAVGGLARTLRARGDELDPVDRGRIVDRMVGACARVADMVDDFVDYWDLTADGAPVATHPVDVSSLLETVLEEVHDGRTRIVLDVDAAEIHATPELLRRIVVGLVRNALDHTPDDTPVHVRVRVLDARLVLAVEDDGPGIPEELREVVFEPRARLDPDGRGLGVGLTLVRMAVELLGGEIRVLEGAAGGSIFRVDLPGVTTAAAAASPQAS